VTAFWQDLRVVVTGGAGFLGSVVTAALKKRGCTQITVPRSSEFDLRRREDIERLYDASSPDMVIHLAASVGGIGANRQHPGSFFYDNLIMGVQLIECARLHEIPKFVAIGTICAYPKFAAVPFSEDDIWNGYPEETNAPYGLAKKMLLVQAQAYRQQYGANVIYLLPTNLYGPGDNFDHSTSHVIPAMIRKFSEALEINAEAVTFWGDGSPTREFLYVEDAAEGILLAAERYDGDEPVNLGTGEEIAIKDLAEKLKSLTCYGGAIEWDANQPNGQPRRTLSTDRAANLFGFQASVELDDGLERTVAWYRTQGKSGI
jgi:GDP-L-fucose synthase